MEFESGPTGDQILFTPEEHYYLQTVISDAGRDASNPYSIDNVLKYKSHLTALLYNNNGRLKRKKELDPSEVNTEDLFNYKRTSAVLEAAIADIDAYRAGTAVNTEPGVVLQLRRKSD